MMDWIKKVLNWIFGDEEEEPTKPAKPSPKIPSPGAGTGTATTTTRHPVEPQPTVPGGQPAPFPRPWDPDVVLNLDLVKSRQGIRPSNRLNKPGDEIVLWAEALNLDGTRIAKAPVEWVLAATNKSLGIAYTNAAGDASAPYKVQADDMIGTMDDLEPGPADDFPDTGSYIILCFVGGRRIRQLSLLYDYA